MIPSNMDRISVDSITRYLTSSGWFFDKGYTYPNLLVFHKPDKNNQEDTIVLPSSEQYKDFKPRLKEILENLSIIENKSENEIIYDMINPNVDRLKINIQSTSTNNGSLPISYAKRCMEAINQLIIAAASNEIENRPYYKRPKKKAITMANEFLLGQTEQGSFTFVVESSIDRSVNESFDLTDISGNSPINRRIIFRIVQGIRELDLYFENQQSDLYKKGLNANMCQALIRLKESFELETTVKCGIMWAAEYPVKSYSEYSATIYPRTFRLLERSVERLKSTAYIDNDDNRVISYGRAELEEYTDKIEMLQTNKQVTIIARVLRIESDRFRPYLLFVKSDNIDSNSTIIVEVKFNDFMQACLAYEGSKFVEISGEINRSNDRYIVTDVTGFKILD